MTYMTSLPKTFSSWPIILALISVVFNLIMLFPETSIKMDVNDNVFAFSLIKRMNLVLTEIRDSGNLFNLPLLIDHWIPEWAMGFPVFSFYQHLPSLIIVLLYRLTNLELMTVFNWFKYLLLCFYPLVIYHSARKLNLGTKAAGISALSSTLLSTQYLYGTDYNAVVFRGSGMYTQLWGFFFLPLALSYLYQAVIYGKSFLKAIIFLALTLSGHLVFGYIAVLSTPIILLSILANGISIKKFLPHLKRLFFVLASCFLLLAYWFVPLIINQDYQNKSLWDDYTKFNSYGVVQILKWLINGQLFDNGRFPVLTILIAMGFFYSLYKFFGDRLRTKSYLFIPLLFLFWLILYFGRDTFGSFFILPLSDGLHGHRLINGVHLAGIFLIGLCGEWIYLIIRKNRPRLIASSLFLILISLIFYPVVKERYEYLAYNQELIKFHNTTYQVEEKDFARVIKKLKELKNHRINIGRPGNWGRNFTVGGSSAYFVASINNINTIGFEPESWSPNTDIEQFFSEYDPNYYNLFNIANIVAPAEEKFSESSFLKKIAQYGKFVIYQVDTKETSGRLGNFDFINSDTLIYLTKKDRFNLDRLWLGSLLMPAKNHPTLTYNHTLNPAGYQNVLTMNGLNYYQLAKPNTQIGYYNLFGANPFDVNNNLLKFNLATPSGTILSETFTNNSYQATVETQQENLLMLKVTYHPFWKAKVNGKVAEIKTVMPFFMAIKIPAGKHQVEFSYSPVWYKNILLLITITLIPTMYFILRKLTAKVT